MFKKYIIILITACLYPIYHWIMNYFTNNNEHIFYKFITLLLIIVSMIILDRISFVKKIIFKVEDLILNLFKKRKIIQEQEEITIKPRPSAIKGLKSKFYGLGYSLQIHDFQLHDPLIYVSDEINLNIGQDIPFLIIRPMHIHPKQQGVIKVDKHRTLVNYMDMTQAERTAYLHWLSRGRTGTVANISCINLYIKGLAYRFFEENKNKKEIFNEVVRIFQEYGSESVDLCTECLHLLELFSLDSDVVKLYNLMEWQDIVKNKLKLDFKNEKAYSLMWNVITLKKEIINIETVLWYYLRDSKVAKLIQNQQSLECIKQILIENLELKNLDQLKLVKMKQEVAFKNFVYNYTSWELDVNSLEKTKKIIAKVIDEMKYFLLSLHSQSYIESYSLLPAKYKKVIHHPLRENINDLYSKSNVVSITELLIASNMLKDNMDLSSSKIIATILNDNFIAIEPDARVTKKSYALDQKVFLFKQGNNLLCKNLNYLKARLLIDTIYSASTNPLLDEQKQSISSFCLGLWPDLKNEQERIWSRMTLLDLLKEEDLKLSLRTEISTVESQQFVSFLKVNKEVFGIKENRFNKIVELFS